MSMSRSSGVAKGKEKTEATKLQRQYLQCPSCGGILSTPPSLISSVMPSELATGNDYCSNYYRSN
ncbi:hypothetical protein HYC85_028508 [Camellia sinensis]|uniref:Uncharacterized protein n=1 Tax=Camellia sinensis TaxID=4442 RepID=A0A7J7FW39_CAMSI|nr:hypothetical protein HYC85_028508 [Camellia sinensis]